MTDATLLVVALLAAISSCAAPPAEPPDHVLRAEIDAPRETGVGGPVPLRFVLANGSEQALWVLQWHTPLEGLLSDCLEVRRDGEPVPYRGPMVKRGDPSADEWVRVPPAGAVAEEVDLARAWDLSRPGVYEVTFAGRLLDVAEDEAALPRPRDAFRPREIAPATARIEVVAR